MENFKLRKFKPQKILSMVKTKLGRRENPANWWLCPQHRLGLETQVSFGLSSVLCSPMLHLLVGPHCLGRAIHVCPEKLFGEAGLQTRHTTITVDKEDFHTRKCGNLLPNRLGV